MNKQRSFLIAVSLIFLWIGCQSLLPTAPEAEDVLAEPIPELTPQQLENHLIGDEEFGRIFGERSGLGPLFVSNACESCHIGDGKGHPLTTLTRFGRYLGAAWDPMREQGGPQLQHRAISGYDPETIPSEATGVTRLMPPAITGLGYLEAVQDELILALADPEDADGDGISGVPNWISPPDYFVERPHHLPSNGQYIGRFGKKAGAIDLLHQIVTAYKEDMGITTDFDTEENYNVQTGVFTGDDVEDPEANASVVRNVVFYVKTLKTPPRRNKNDPDVLEGEQLFRRINCVGCHVPTLLTGKSDVAAINESAFHPYTDLLLHDMGPELDDGYTEGTASTSEWRTAPLWGIGLAEDSQGGEAFYLHDGRARTLEQAIQLHGGEAADSGASFTSLSAKEKEQLISFLKSL
ncbi:MAG: di-heme oxidoredictase family protein [bacterium]